MATGATHHLEGMRCGSPVPRLPVLPHSHLLSDRRKAQGPAGNATPQFVTLHHWGKKPSRHGKSPPSGLSQYLTPPASKSSGTDRCLAHQ